MDNHTQNTLLRGQLGFRGMIVSDCGAETALLFARPLASICDRLPPSLRIFLYLRNIVQ